MVKNLPVDTGDPGSIPGSRRSPGGGHGKPVQYSCLENLMNRGAWHVTIQRVRCDLVTKQQKHIKVFLDPGCLLSVAVPWIYASSRKLQITECEVKRT